MREASGKVYEKEYEKKRARRKGEGKWEGRRMREGGRVGKGEVVIGIMEEEEEEGLSWP